MEYYIPMESKFVSLEHGLYKLIEIFERFIDIEKIANTICCVNKSHVITHPDFYFYYF